MIKVKLIEKIAETEDVISFIFQPDREVTWKAGQYIYYRIPHEDADSRGIERHFTISSAPHEKVIRLTSKFDLKNGSSFKRALYGLEPGKTIEAYNIGGSFTINEFGKKYVLLAGGIGITPYRSILLDIVRKEGKPDMTMLYGNKDEDNITFRDLIDRIEDENRWFDVNYIIEPQLIDEDIVKRNVEDVYNSIYYISGPMKMVKIMEDMLLKMNIDKDKLLVDYFPGYGDQ